MPFTPTDRITLIRQLSIAPYDIYRFTTALSDIEQASILYDVDWVSEIQQLSAKLTISESGTEMGGSGSGTDAPETIDLDPANALYPMLALQAQGVKSIRTEEVTIEFKDGASGSGLTSDGTNYRRKILEILASFGYHFDGGSARILRS